MRRIILIILVLIAAFWAQAQHLNLETKFRIAQSFEANGDLENAVKVYEEIYTIDSTNVVYFEALLNCYDKLKRYDDAKRIIQSKLQKRPNDINLISRLGKIYARAGEIKEAENIWQRIIDNNPNNLSVYSIVANAMIDSRLFESALKVYEIGRKTSKIESAFASEIGYLHSLLMNYSEATKEYLLLLRQSPEQLNFIQSRMSLYTSKSDGLKAAIYITEEALGKDENNLSLNRLIAWLYMEGKEYEKAMKIYIAIDEITKSGGIELFAFAERTKREGAFKVASNAYQEIIKNYPKFPNIPAVRFGFAETMEASIEEIDTLKIFGTVHQFKIRINIDTVSNKYKDVIKLYEQVATQYPNTEFAARAYYRIASIYFNIFFDIENCLKLLNEIENRYKHSNIILSDALILKASVLVAKGQIEEAKMKLDWLISYAGSTAEHKDLAKFKLAEINYYLGNFKDALKTLEDILRTQSKDIVNDAILLQVFIQDNIEDEKNLKLYAEAQLLMKQQKLEDAKELLRKVSESKSELAANAISELGDINTYVGNYKNAIAEYEKLLKDYSDNLLADKTLLKLAELYHYAIKDKLKAEEYYRRILEEHPTSIYINVARQKIREIRGDAL